MSYFVDEIRIRVVSGDGGHGCVSFRREKYIPRGGPDGGDGGRGGDVIFQVRRNVKTLTHINRHGTYKAQVGQPGRGAGKYGRDGEDVIIVVPPGTLIKDAETRDTLVEFQNPGDDFTFLRGGKGGQGNIHFKTSRNQAPRYAQTGLNGETRDIILELSLIADIGFVGLPNAGKSSLLKAITQANPKVGAYPFTTRIPQLGVLYMHETDIILADIPGIIEGASEGLGLGTKFLKHISRVAAIAYMIDMSDGSDQVATYEILKKELDQYGHNLNEKRSIIVASKMDQPESEEALEAFKKAYPKETIYPISSHSTFGLDKLTKTFFELYTQFEKELIAQDEVKIPRHPYDWDGADRIEEEVAQRLKDQET